MIDKSLTSYQIKGQNIGLKDISLDKKEVAMYLAHFDNMDSDNDVILKGAFKKSLLERGVDSTSNRKIAFLRYHDWEKPIGKFIRLEEDQNGLFAVAKLSDSSLGKDALIDYEEGIIREHSIGFKYIKDKVKFIKDESLESGGFFQISEVALWEGSAVTFGANEMTPVLAVGKSANKKDKIKEVSNDLEQTIKAIVKGQGTDERLYNLEMKAKFLNAQLIELSLIKEEPKQQPEEEKGFDWNFVYKELSVKETYADYPAQAVKNARRGIELNKKNNNKCATDVGKQRARDIVAKRGFSLSVLNRVYSYLSRAKAYYNPEDENACGTISYLLWGGEAMRVWSERKLNEINND